MRRRIVAFFAALSLLLCVATAVLWVRSYWVKDDVRHVFGPAVPTRLSGNLVRKSVLLSSSSGKCIIRYTPHLSVVLGFEPCIEDGNWFFERSNPDAARVEIPAARFGFGWATDGNRWEVQLPDYALVGTFGLAAVVFFAGARRLKARKPLCPSCHYNLTGNVSGACPECGAAVR